MLESLARHALDLVQPYGLAVDVYLGLPASLVGREHSKKELGRAVAGDLLPGWIFERPKVRAQVGDSKQPRGILPVLAASGRDAGWLRKAFSELFGIGEETFLNGFVRAGMYRSLRAFPEKPAGNGYLKHASGVADPRRIGASTHALRARAPASAALNVPGVRLGPHPQGGYPPCVLALLGSRPRPKAAMR